MKSTSNTKQQYTNQLDFLHGDGEMINLIRQKNWEDTSVGPPDGWPNSLRRTLSMILETKFPMFIFWGEDMVCFYNDAYRPSLGNDGKHPAILGEKGKESWEEIWDIIFPLLDHVRKTGEAYWSEDQLVPIYRNGKIEDVYWTFSYGAIRNENHTIGGILVTCSETTEKVNYLNKLKESEDQLRFAIEAAELGSWDYDPVKDNLTGNIRLKKWVGLENEELIDLNLILDCVIDEDRERVRDKVLYALNPETTANFDEQFTIKNRKTGNKIIVRSMGSAWFKDGMAIRFNGTLQDVTAQVQEHARFLKETNDTLQNFIIQLQRSNEELQSFAYVSSHDLQEPLRKITIFISRIKDRQKLGQEDMQDFERIIKAAERMRQLITDLLDYSKIGEKGASQEVVDVESLVREVSEDLSGTLNSKNVHISIDKLPKLKVIPYQFKQLFGNLFNNAIKFAKEEVPLQINISGEHVGNIRSIFKHADATVDYYKITFEDNGIGFKQEHSQRIFEVFQKLHNKSDYSGTGIGLSIVKKIIDGHNGFIQAISEDGKGAKFVMYFPYNQNSI